VEWFSSNIKSYATLEYRSSSGAHRLIVDAVLGVIQEKTNGLDRQTLTALRIIINQGAPKTPAV
jgi:hypothetical protein